MLDTSHSVIVLRAERRRAVHLRWSPLCAPRPDHTGDAASAL
jgi:hypothetical protein